MANVKVMIGVRLKLKVVRIKKGKKKKKKTNHFWQIFGFLPTSKMRFPPSLPLQKKKKKKKKKNSGAATEFRIRAMLGLSY